MATRSPRPRRGGPEGGGGSKGTCEHVPIKCNASRKIWADLGHCPTTAFFHAASVRGSAWKELGRCDFQFVVKVTGNAFEKLCRFAITLRRLARSTSDSANFTKRPFVSCANLNASEPGSTVSNSSMSASAALNASASLGCRSFFKEGDHACEFQPNCFQVMRAKLWGLTSQWTEFQQKIL